MNKYKYHEFPWKVYDHDLHQYELREEDKIIRIDKNGKMKGIKGVSRKPRWRNWNGIHYETWTVYLTKEGERRIKRVLQ